MTGSGSSTWAPHATAAGSPGSSRPTRSTGSVEGIYERAGQESRLSTGRSASNVDIYQVNTTYYDALGRDDHRYLLARALQFFTPGLPQVYYVGLLAGHNDLALLAQTGVGRDINRGRYLTPDVEEHLARPVVAALFELIRFRNAHPAFTGDFDSGGSGAVITMTWTQGEHRTTLTANLVAGQATITWTDRKGRLQRTANLLNPPWHTPDDLSQ